MTHQRSLLAAFALLLSGCQSENEPDPALIRILTVGQSQEAAECEARLLTESDMSDEGAMRMAVGVGSNTAMDDDFDLDEIASDLSDDDRAAFRRIAAAFTDCLD